MCNFCKKVREFMTRLRNPTKLIHARKVLEKRASIAKMQDIMRLTRTRLATARVELKAMRKGG